MTRLLTDILEDFPPHLRGLAASVLYRCFLDILADPGWACRVKPATGQGIRGGVVDKPTEVCYNECAGN